MSKTYTGFVAKISTKDGKTSKGKPWTLYSAKIEKTDGSEYPEWISFGFNKPGFSEGDYVTFEAEEKDGRHNFVEGSGKKPKNAPARAKKERQSSGGGAPSGGKSTWTPRPEDPARQRQIVEQHSQEIAVRLIDVMLEHKALPLSKADTKAGESKRYEEIMAYFKKLTREVSEDIITARLSKTVADAGAVDTTKTDGDSDVEADEPDGDPSNGDDTAGDADPADDDDAGF